jgi:anti-anti-sigma regulatory factor
MENLVKQFVDISVIRFEKNRAGLADTRRLENTMNGLVAKGAKRIALDLSTLTQVSSDFVGLLIRKRRDLISQKGSLVLYGVKGQVLEYIETLGLDQFIQINEGRAAVS